MTETTFIPLSLTIMLGPQILVAMLLITRKDAVQSSLIYIFSVVASLIGMTYLYSYLISITHFHKIAITGKPVIKYILVAVLVFVLIRTIKNRKKITQKPKWMTNVLTCSLKKVALIGFALIALMPADIAVEFTIGNLINVNHSTILSAVPFFIAVLVLASTPLFIYKILGNKGPGIMEKTNVWLNTHGYLINVFVLSLYIFLILK
ncbi:GAP family protein [Formosa sp. PL04]|uniref:GAP family protein n=1 Tax=Formosa sp. PL04 TaxID=3081755 RepID=UPI0029829CCF|nr:GAP family protein [Formosa sp. PL04]MDW5290596.1 GAP family protein [Formosa sp. PL04]